MTTPTMPTVESTGSTLSDEELAKLADPASYAAPESDCDLIMKGGITSGVVYPLTACRLATRFRLRRLGGASAGAIAAAFAAAAELGRHRPVDLHKPTAEAPGFVGLQNLPAEMGANLDQLFQPTAELGTAYRVLTTWIEPGWGVLRRIATTVARIVARMPWLFILVTALALVPGFAATATLLDSPEGVERVRLLRTLLIFLPGAVGLGLLASTAWVVVSTLRGLARHGFGLCNGHTSQGLQSRSANGLDDKPSEHAGWPGRRWHTVDLR